MSYDSDVSSVTTSLKSSNPTVFSETTINDILGLSTKTDAIVKFTNVEPDVRGNITVPAGSEVMLVNTSDIVQTSVKVSLNAPVVIFQGRGGVVATINDGITAPSGATKVERVVIGSAGNDKIEIADATNTKIVLGSGDSSVQTGGGVDTVQAGLGNSTITGGTGDYAVVKLAGNATNYTVTTNNGHAIVTDQTTRKTTDISKIQYVQLDNGNALIFAKNSLESSVARLYRGAFGRDADAGGLDFWFDAARGGATMKQIARGFTNSSEFATQNSNKTDKDFVQFLYQNNFGRAGEEAGVALWLDSLKNGGSRADLIASFAEIATQNAEGTALHQEATVVGSVKIVTGII